ncbi:MAG: hypothetical protein KDD70_08155 [Bdellovibrionales bacterium]|nr:hypothetical protein [Bdellovibrionales bacterium]
MEDEKDCIRASKRIDLGGKSISQQLGLSITPKLTFDPDRFVLHSGVRAVAEALLSRCLDVSKHYPLCSVVGENRSGKTHFAHYLASKLRPSHGDRVALLRGSELNEFVTDGGLVLAQEAQLVLLIDEADGILSQYSKGRSGTLVNVVEALRKHHGSIVFFRKNLVDEYSFDEHLLSRFQAGIEFPLEEPSRDEALELLQVMAIQRGFKFAESKLRFLEKRLSISIQEIESYLERVQLLTRVRDDKVNFSLLDDAL